MLRGPARSSLARGAVQSGSALALLGAPTAAFARRLQVNGAGRLVQTIAAACRTFAHELGIVVFSHYNLGCLVRTFAPAPRCAQIVSVVSVAAGVPRACGSR